MRNTFAVLLLASCAAGNAFAAVSCPTPQRPVQPAGIAPVAAELASATAPLGTPGSVLAQAYDESQSLDQVLLRIRIEACRDVAIATPAPGVLSPEDPAAYKPRTQYDNTPWRFNMNQNGRISGNFGYGSAVAVVMFIISLIIALTYQRFVLRRDTEGALTGGGRTR